MRPPVEPEVTALSTAAPAVRTISADTRRAGIQRLTERNGITADVADLGSMHLTQQTHSLAVGWTHQRERCLTLTNGLGIDLGLSLQ